MSAHPPAIVIDLLTSRGQCMLCPTKAQNAWRPVIQTSAAYRLEQLAWILSAQRPTSAVSVGQFTDKIVATECNTKIHVLRIPCFEFLIIFHVQTFFIQNRKPPLPCWMLSKHQGKRGIIVTELKLICHRITLLIDCFFYFLFFMKVSLICKSMLHQSIWHMQN